MYVLNKHRELGDEVRVASSHSVFDNCGFSQPAFIKKLYKKDRVLAIKAAKILGYEVKNDKVELIDTLNRTLFNQINKYANSNGFRFRSTADEFEAYMKKFLIKNIR